MKRAEKKEQKTPPVVKQEEKKSTPPVKEQEDKKVEKKENPEVQVIKSIW